MSSPEREDAPIGDYRNSPLLRSEASLGADTVLRHEASGQSLYLFSHRMRGWSESFLCARLSNCHLPLRALVDFFESISLVAHSDVRLNDGSTRGLFDGMITWSNKLLVGDVLGIVDNELFESFEPFSLGNKRTVRQDAKLVEECLDRLYSLLDIIDRHTDAVIQHLIRMTCCCLCGVDFYRQDIFDRMATLAVKFGHTFHGQCIMILGGGNMAPATSSYYKPSSHRYLHALGPVESAVSPPDLDYSNLKYFEVDPSPPPSLKVDAAYVCAHDEHSMDDLPFTLAKTVVRPIQGRATINSRSMFDGELCVRLSIKEAHRGSLTVFDLFGANLKPRADILIPYALEPYLTYHLVEVVEVTEYVLELHHRSCLAFGERGTLCLVKSGKFKDVKIVLSPLSSVSDCILRVGPVSCIASANFALVAGDVEMKIHDWVLYDKWSYFKHVVDAGMRETVQRRLTLPSDFPPIMLVALVSFIYDRNRDMNTLVLPKESWDYAKENAVLYGFGQYDATTKAFAPNPFWKGFFALEEAGTSLHTMIDTFHRTVMMVKYPKVPVPLDRFNRISVADYGVLRAKVDYAESTRTVR